MRVTRASPLSVGIDYRPALLTRTGIGRAVRELVRGMSRHPEIRIHLFAHSLARARHELAPGPRLHRLPIPGRSMGLLARAGVGADRLAGSPELFHWTDCVHPPVTRAATVLSIYDLSFAEDSSFHGVNQARILFDRTRRAAARSRLVIVPTAATRRAAERFLGLNGDRLRTVPLGADHLPSRVGTDPLPGRPYLVALGTIEPRKNHLRILAAWRRQKAPRPRLVVIGRPGWCSETAIAELREEERRGEVIWLQNADDLQAFRYLAHARVALYPSLLEGFGFPPLEAMGLGVPVLAGETPALREVLEDNAVFCDPTDVDDMADCLARLLEDDQLRSEMIAAGQNRVRAFTWDRAAAGHAAAYREAMP